MPRPLWTGRVGRSGDGGDGVCRVAFWWEHEGNNKNMFFLGEGGGWVGGWRRFLVQSAILRACLGLSHQTLKVSWGFLLICGKVYWIRRRIYPFHA